MSQSLRVFVANHLPWLGNARRLVRAVIDVLLPVRKSYAQHGEDRWVLGRLAGADLGNAIYVDVGAFHPTSISNNYLFYRRRLSGVLIEPNLELARLNRRIRPATP